MGVLGVFSLYLTGRTDHKATLINVWGWGGWGSGIGGGLSNPPPDKNQERGGIESRDRLWQSKLSTSLTVEDRTGTEKLAMLKLCIQDCKRRNVGQDRDVMMATK